MINENVSVSKHSGGISTGIVSRDPNSYVTTDEFDHQVKAQGNRKTRLDCAMEKNADEYFFNQITECTFSCSEANIWPGSWAFFHVTVGLRLQTSSIFSL